MVNQVINCPNCGANVDVKQAIYQDIEAKHKVEFAQELQQIKQEKERLEQQKQQQDKLIADKLADSKISLKKEIAKELKAKYAKEGKLKEDKLQQELIEKSKELQQLQSTAIENERLKREKEELEKKYQLDAEKQLNAAKREIETKTAKELKAKFAKESKLKEEQLQQELTEKSKEVQQLQSTAIENERLKREKDELEQKYKLDAEKQITKKLKEEEQRIKDEQQEEHQFKMAELQKQLDDQKKLTEEMKRKQEQGSMQLQGEVQELAIENYLATEFPLDTIEEIKKGQRGADCLQIVNTYEQQNCGSIYYESKRTKNFEPKWIAKFKEDIQAKNANLGVLVTQAMPKDMQQAGYRDGIIICSFNEIKGLVGILRQWLIKVSSTAIAQANRGEKKELIYSYITSDSFKLQIENILASFNSLKKLLDDEKKKMKDYWAKREKQLEIIIDSTTHIHGSVKGIAGTAIPSIPELEFD